MPPDGRVRLRRGAGERVLAGLGRRLRAYGMLISVPRRLPVARSYAGCPRSSGGGDTATTEEIMFHNAAAADRHAGKVLAAITLGTVKQWP